MEKFDRIISRMANLFSVLSSLFIIVLSIGVLLYVKEDLLDSKNSYNMSSFNLGFVTFEKTINDLDQVITSGSDSDDGTIHPSEIQIVAAKTKENILSEVRERKEVWVFLGKEDKANNIFESNFNISKLPKISDSIVLNSPIYKRQGYPKKVNGGWKWGEVLGVFTEGDSTKVLGIHTLYDNANAAEYWGLVIN